MKIRVPVLVRPVVLGLSLVLLATACGGGSDAEEGAGPVLVEQGAQSIDTSDLTPATSEPVDATSGGAAEGDVPGEADAGSATTTLPQNEASQEEKVDDLFTAMRTFNECLEDEGRPFIGFDPNAPDDDPRRQPEYIEALGKCAAVSQIQEAMASADLGSDGKTPEEIEERNRGTVRFVDCLKGRGWNPAPLEPDENGMLQVGDLGAPEGESMLGGDDMDDCRQTATDAADDDEG